MLPPGLDPQKLCLFGTDGDWSEGTVSETIGRWGGFAWPPHKQDFARQMSLELVATATAAGQVAWQLYAFCWSLVDGARTRSVGGGLSCSQAGPRKWVIRW